MEKLSATSTCSFQNLGKNISSVQNFLKEAYIEKKATITNGLSFFKDELSASVDKTGDYLHLITSPVNNFVKDVNQIEKEFEQELTKSQEYCICLDGKMVPASEILARPMEENY